MIQTDKRPRFLLYHEEMLVNMNFSRVKMFNQKKDLLEKAATLKRFEYSLIRKELKSQTDIEQKQYQRLDNTFEFDKLIKKEQPTLGKCSKSNVIDNSNYNFYKCYRDSKNN